MVLRHAVVRFAASFRVDAMSDDRRKIVVLTLFVAIIATRAILWVMWR